MSAQAHRREPDDAVERAQAEEELVMFLERDQLVTDRSRRLPRARLSHRASVALWALRIFGLVMSALVIYTFCAALAG